MEKRNFEILSSNSRDMGCFRLFQASQARALAGAKIDIFQKKILIQYSFHGKKEF